MTAGQHTPPFYYESEVNHESTRNNNAGNETINISS